MASKQCHLIVLVKFLAKKLSVRHVEAFGGWQLLPRGNKPSYSKRKP